MDAPEQEGVMVRVLLDSESEAPRLGLGVMVSPDATLTVRLDAEGTEFVRSLLEG
jgi:hypothetical protein